MTEFCGVAHKAAHFIMNEQMLDAKQWAKFVDLYRSQPDGTNQGWRGEYWGKMMRGAVLVYEYTRDERLLAVLTDTVRDMISVAEEDGRVSSYSRDTEFDSWDLWGRKYVMLASEYYLEICPDEQLKEQLIQFICGCADYIIDHIGPEEGKKCINDATRCWGGMNSSSILEPVVRLYTVTNDKKYLDFATYIVNEGGSKGVNIFELAYENKIYPYQYGVSKAYEMMSCFEGLLEYYRVTGIEKHKISVVNFAKAIMESEVSIIGSCGITHELLDHTRTRQTVDYEGVKQETCVTVTWMKLCSRLLELTGESCFADAMEQSFYNAYLGAINTEYKDSVHFFEKLVPKRGAIRTYMPFDSYSPLIPGKRGRWIGGDQILPDKTYYGCCACIGAAGIGVFLKSAVTADAEGIVVNFFERGSVQLEYAGVGVTLDIDTDYPTDGSIRIKVRAQSPVRMKIKVRNPEWSNAPSGYSVWEKEWSDDQIELCFDMTLKLHYPERWDEDVIYTDTSRNPAYYFTADPVVVHHNDSEDAYYAITRGPLVLAADSRMGRDVKKPFPICASATECEDRALGDTECMLKLRFTAPDGEQFCLVDYSSAGKDWDADMAAWLPTK